MLSRDEALKLVTKYNEGRHHIRHMIAVEAIMRELAKFLGKDENKWGLVGLLHDLDFEQTYHDIRKHGVVSAEILSGIILKDEINSILAHNFENTGVNPSSDMDVALIAADAVSGFIIATALVTPTKRLRDVSLKTLIRKFRDKNFARGSNRDRIKISVELGLPVEDFFSLSLQALQKIADHLQL